MNHNIIVLFLFVLLSCYTIQTVEGQCSSRTDCNTCTADTTCGWCMNTVQGTAACLSGSASGPSGGVWCKEWRFLKSQTGNPVGGFPFNPSQIDAYVLNGSPLTIPLVFTVPPQDTLPLDLVVLQDNSGSMAPAINALYKIVPKLINGVIAFQYDVKFGLATFIDNKSSGYTGVEIYRLRNALTSDYNSVGLAIQALAGNVHGNYDNPETGYDAMMYAAVGGPNPDNLPGSTTANCQNFGWRSSARHVAILITDDYPKCTDTYSLLGTSGDGFQRPSDADPKFPATSGYLANNADCVLNGINPSNGYMDGSYSGEFHPSAAQVADQFSAQKKDIIPIFYTAQTASSGNTGLYSFYTGQKNNVFKRGNQGDLNSATVTLDQLVISTLKDAAATVAPVIYSDPSGFVSPATVTITSNPCCPNYATSSCTGLLVPGCKVYMSVTITRGSTNTAAGDVVVRVPGFGNNAISTIHVKTSKFFCDGCNLAIPNSVVDYCGVCNGKNASCTDCFGVVVAPGSQITKVDACGVCGGDGSSCFDCNSLSYNTAPTAYHYDDCNVCRQRTDPLWNTTCVDCAGTKYGTAKYDFCGVCNGNNACVGCDGVAAINGIVKKVYDSCGICGGDGSSCKGCDGGSTPPLKLYDACGVCGGNSDTCLGCPGNSTIYPVGDPYHDNPPKVDACGVCGGDNSTCYGCDGIRNSTKTYDICGACTDGSTPPACLDCLGLPFGTTQNDACGNCGGKQTDKSKCNVAGTDPAVIAGAVIGATVAATIAAVALFMLYQFKKNPRWYYQDAVDQLDAGQQHNPLYESAGHQKDNPLYTGGK